ncbi:MAG: hypothetical protein QM773_10400 [Hyphomonadaceae bacterium]
MVATPPATAVSPARELSRYAAEAKPQVESTHVDRGVEARARAMLSPDVVAPLPNASIAFSPHDHDHDHDHDEYTGLGRPVLPGFGAAMAVRVRFMGGEVPLWSLLAPVVIVASLSAALAAAAASHAPAPSADEAAARALSSAQAEAPSALPSSAPAPLAVATPGSVAAASGSAEGLELPVGNYAAKDVLAIAEKRSAREVAAARALAASLDRDPGAAQEPRTLSELRRLSENQDTARIALESMAKLPAPLSADMLYEVWTGTVERNDITELSRALLFSKDVRPKASKALSVALDLRASESCEKTQQILPRAEADADRRSLHLLIKLQRKYGCGPNKRADCYPCLRSGDALENSVKAARERPEPRVFGKR